MNTITLNGTEYIPATEAALKPPASIRILVLQRGWIIVGNVHDDPESDELTITKSAAIRLWGTTKGLGEIALNGPTSKTVLDPAGTCRVHRLAVVLSIDCEESKWATKLS